MADMLGGSLEEDWQREKAGLRDEQERRRRARGAVGGAAGGNSCRPIGGGGGCRAEAGGRSFSSPAKPFASSQRRQVVVRFKAVATGSQSAQVKVASYGGGIRIGPMMDYVSRDGDLSLENGRGERLQTKADFARLDEEWSPLFQNRTDTATLQVFVWRSRRGSMLSTARISARVSWCQRSLATPAPADSNRTSCSLIASRCLVPAIGGALFSQEWRDALWDKFYTGAPGRQRQSVEQYKIVK